MIILKNIILPASFFATILFGGCQDSTTQPKPVFQVDSISPIYNKIEIIAHIDSVGLISASIVTKRGEAPKQINTKMFYINSEIYNKSNDTIKSFCWICPYEYNHVVDDTINLSIHHKYECYSNAIGLTIFPPHTKIPQLFQVVVSDTNKLTQEFRVGYKFILTRRNETAEDILDDKNPLKRTSIIWSNKLKFEKHN